jgi:hypothetical protein
MSLKGLIEDVPENVDLIVAREQRVFKDTVTAAVAKDAQDLAVFKSQTLLLAGASITTVTSSVPVIISAPAIMSAPAPAAAATRSLSHLSVPDVALIVRAAPHVVSRARFTSVAGVVQGRGV